MAMNKKMDEILNECLERVVFHDENAEDVLRAYPDQAKELRPLLQTALSVKKAAAIAPREEFRARARYQFHQALAAKQQEKHGFLTGFMPRWAAALSIALAIILASGSTVAAASSSMPDSILYPVKLATEQARVTMTLTEAGKAELYAELTDKRVEEIVYLATKGDNEKVVIVTRKLDESAGELAKLAQVAYGNTQDTAMLPAPAAASAKSLAPSPAIREAAPQLAQPPIAGGGAAGQNQTFAGAPAPSPTLPPQPKLGVTAAENHQPDAVASADSSTNKSSKEPKLKTILTTNAVKHPAQLRAALEKVPDPVKQNILNSIAKTAESYERAIRSIDEDRR